VDVASGSASYDREADSHAERGAHEHPAAPEDIVETSAGACEYPACDGVDGVEKELDIRVCYSYVFDEQGKILDIVVSKWDKGNEKVSYV